jgi:hypothetical protein
MRARLLRIGLAFIAALTLFVTPILAQGRGRGHGKARGNSRVVVRSDVGRHDRGRVVIVRDRVIYPNLYRYGDSGRPPGWDRGRKVGWGNCDVPPGLAKKYGCRNTYLWRDTNPRRSRVIIFPWLGF